MRDARGGTGPANLSAILAPLVGAQDWEVNEMDQQLEGFIQELQNADLVAFSEPGCEAGAGAVTYAFEVVKGNLSPRLRPRLERLLDRATPAGRVYAATLLDRIDPQAGRDAWGRLADDHNPVDTCRGSDKARTTVAEYAASHRVRYPA
jgi:hypothetical protein